MWTTGVSNFTFSISTASQLILGSNPRRCAVIFSPAEAVDYTLQFGEVPVTLYQGINLYAKNPPVKLHWREFGCAFFQPIFVVASGDATISAIEFIFLEEPQWAQQTLVRQQSRGSVRPPTS